MSVATGQTAGTEQASTREWSPFSGMAKTRRMEGVTAASLAAKEAELQSQSWPYRVKDLGIKWEIEWTEQNTFLSIPGLDATTPLSDVWELQAATSEKDLMESDLPLPAAVTDADRSTIKEYVNGSKKFTEALALVDSDGEAVLRLLDNGMKSVTINQPILRRVRVVTNKYGIRDSLANVGKVITATKIAALENVPSALLFNLPTIVNPANPKTGVSAFYGWYKRYPTVLQQPEGKWQINLEYHWGLWSEDVYTFIS